MEVVHEFCHIIFSLKDENIQKEREKNKFYPVATVESHQVAIKRNEYKPLLESSIKQVGENRVSAHMYGPKYSHMGCYFADNLLICYSTDHYLSFQFPTSMAVQHLLSFLPRVFSSFSSSNVRDVQRFNFTHTDKINILR